MQKYTYLSDHEIITKQKSKRKRLLNFVRVERLELSHLAALDPKSSASTNSATPAFKEGKGIIF